MTSFYLPQVLLHLLPNRATAHTVQKSHVHSLLNPPTHQHTHTQAKEHGQSTLTTEPKPLIQDEAQEDSSDSELGELPISRPPGDEEGQVDASSSSSDDKK